MSIDQKQWVLYFDFLDALRISGITNMFGAGPYLVNEYQIEPAEARKVLNAWIKTFGDGTESAEIRVQKV